MFCHKNISFINMLFLHYILRYTLRCSIKRAVLITLNWSRLQWKLRFLLLIYGCIEITCLAVLSLKIGHIYDKIQNCMSLLLNSVNTLKTNFKPPLCSSTFLQWPNSFLDVLTDLLFIINKRNDFGHEEKPRNPTNNPFYLLEAPLLCKVMLCFASFVRPSPK